MVVQSRKSGLSWDVSQSRRPAVALVSQSPGHVVLRLIWMQSTRISRLLASQGKVCLATSLL